MLSPGWWGWLEGLWGLLRVWGGTGTLNGGGEETGDGEEQLCFSRLTSEEPSLSTPAPSPAELSSTQPLCPNTLCTHLWLRFPHYSTVL